MASWYNKAIVNGVPRIGYMKGGEKAKWSDIDMEMSLQIKQKNI